MAVTMQQIAEACGVSRGTVDRALRGREGVRPEVARHIQETARELGYLPRHASPLKEEKPVRIGVVLHTGVSAFVRQLAGLLAAYPSQALLPIETIVRTMDGTDVPHQLALIDELAEQERVDGLAIMPLASALLRDKINELSEKRGLPVVTINTDIADCARLAYVGPDNIACGRTAGALLGMAMGSRGRVLPILGQRSGHFADTQRLSGFYAEISEAFPAIEMLPPEYCFLDQGLAERITLRALREVEGLTGIYLSSVGRGGVYRALERAGQGGRVHVVVHDLTRDNLQMIRAGVVDFAIGQGVKTQGSLPLLLLYQYLTGHVSPEKRRYSTEIEVKFRCNLLPEDEACQTPYI